MGADAERGVCTIFCADLGRAAQSTNPHEGTAADAKDCLDTVLVPLVAQCGGSIVKTFGNSVVAEFSSPTEAVYCGVLARERAQLGSAIGIALGEVVHEGGDISGGALDVARRLVTFGNSGEVWVSASARERIQQDDRIVFVDLGQHALGDPDQPVHVYLARWPRRGEEKRQRLEAALRPFVARYQLPPDTLERLSNRIYQLYREYLGRNRSDEADHRVDAAFRRNVRRIAERNARSPGRDAGEYAAHMIKLETLERRKMGRQKAIDRASKATWDSLSPAEKRRARNYLRDDVLRGSKVRRSSFFIDYLREVAALLEREIGRSLPFNSYPPGTKRPRGAGGRHYGPAFDVMMAAAHIADHHPTNEAMAALIRRVRGSTRPRSPA